ncbi:MAG: hypothetical protein OD918_04000 [Gammaproteobacteria bacterium]
MPVRVPARKKAELRGEIAGHGEAPNSVMVTAKTAFIGARRAAPGAGNRSAAGADG